jgi:NADH-quinone oxidoreductase subunit G
MPTITIDGQEISVEAGTTVIEAAERLGIYIPRYCYHPGLSIAGSCRMCLVEIEKFPNLQISCNTRVQEGMRVTTDSERVAKARQAMLEFLLSDHPLDCPVCDQSGECDLQNFYMEHGRYQSRFLENKIKRKKAFPVGPHVVLDQERCILCTRCSRFTDEVTGTHELGVFNRGDRSVIDLYPGRALDNPYSGNVIDICPVGALTESEFRFQCRVWYLSNEDSICNGCSRGCNISIHTNQARTYKARGRRVMRIKPRFNPEVNRWWICDRGRFGYEFIDHNRIETPCLRSGDRLLPEEWHVCVKAAAELIRTTIERHGADSVGIIASPQMSNEELRLCRRLFGEGLEIPHLAYRNPWEEAAPEDDFLMRADGNPNSRGAGQAGFSGDTRAILEKAAAGDIRLLYIFRHTFDGVEAMRLPKGAARLVYQGVNWNALAEAADVVLAGTTHAEKEGTFTNFEGRVQRFRRALPPLEESRDDSEILRRLGDSLGIALPSDTGDVPMDWIETPPDEIGSALAPPRSSPLRDGPTTGN